MIIRTPDFSDYDRIMELLTEMADYNELTELQNPDYNDKYIRNLLTECMKSGIIYVGEYRHNIEGIIIGIPIPNIWLTDVIWMREIAFWVSNSARYTTMGARLLKHYRKKAISMVQQGLIDNFIITSLEKMPVDYGKLGFQQVETNWAWSK